MTSPELAVRRLAGENSRLRKALDIAPLAASPKGGSPWMQAYRRWYRLERRDALRID
ncbi:MAG: hypothetical protein ACE145_20915 [Terriglobia bacterium]